MIAKETFPPPSRRSNTKDVATPTPFRGAAMKGILWYETIDKRMHLDPIAFAYDYMMRTGRVGGERLRRLDPEFADLVKRHRL